MRNPHKVPGPKVWVRGTSAASRPCAMRTRPIRGAVVAWVERVPTAAEIDFDPRREIVGRIGRWNADIGEVASAIACNGKMSIVTAHPVPLSVCFQCCSGRTGVLVTECYVGYVRSRRWPAPAANQAACFRRVAKPRRTADRSHGNDCRAKTL